MDRFQLLFLTLSRRSRRSVIVLARQRHRLGSILSLFQLISSHRFNWLLSVNVVLLWFAYIAWEGTVSKRKTLLSLLLWELFARVYNIDWLCRPTTRETPLYTSSPFFSLIFGSTAINSKTMCLLCCSLYHFFLILGSNYSKFLDVVNCSGIPWNHDEPFTFSTISVEITSFMCQNILCVCNHNRFEHAIPFLSFISATY